MSSNNPERKKTKKSRSCFRVGGGEKKEKVFNTFILPSSLLVCLGEKEEKHIQAKNVPYPKFL
jgi:hypothetical protein